MTLTARSFQLFGAAAVFGSLVACQSHHRGGAEAHSPAHAPAHWGYAGEVGPASWSGLSPEYSACAQGHCQSPIDVVGPRGEDLANIVFDYQSSAINIVNNGHTIQVNYDPGSSITLDGKRYELAQFHFHAPSEHRIGGTGYAAEMHLVHKASDGELAVVGVLINPGNENRAFEQVWSQLPATPGPVQQVSGRVNAADLLPATRTSFRYGGSLTTPPCSETVKWTLLTTPIEMSKGQIQAYTRLYSGNNRPVQALNGRIVVEDTTP